MQFYQFHIGDYAKNTAHLTDDEDLAYRRLLDLYYDTEKPLDKEANRVARRVRMAEKESAVKSILEEFFTLTDLGWKHEVCERNIKSYNKMRDGGRKTAAKRWKNKDKLNNSPPTPTLQGGNNLGDDDPNANHKPITINHKPITIIELDKSNSKTLPKPNYSESFLEFWNHYPKQRIGSKPDAWKSWKKILAGGEIDESGLIAVCMAYAASEEVERGFAKGCAAWLNDDRWRNDYSIKTGANNANRKSGKSDYFSTIMQSTARAAQILEA